MADILHMPARARPKGRRRKQPIEGAPLADVIEAIRRMQDTEPTYAEIRRDLNQVAHHLLRAIRAAEKIFPADG